MDFLYFKGPNEHMADLVIGKQLCSICNQEQDYCFHLEFSITNKFPDEEKEGKVGCIDCLRNGEFEFWHDTEFGVLDENGLRKEYSHNMDNPPKLDNNILNELRRTPQIATYQQELWLTHCNDFMIYKGIWKPLDFYLNSPDGDGRQMFMQMTDEGRNLWDESLEEGKTLLEDWYPTYYVFECRHCHRLRGNWDCD